jgi:glycosyltransferase involved in cell wall biosynthesis
MGHILKVLHVNGARGYGGNEQQLIDVANKLSELGVSNGVFCADKSELSKLLENSDDIISFIADHRSFKSLENRRYFKKIILEFEPDIIHLHNSNSLSLFIYTNVFSKIHVPVVFSKKGMGSSMSFLSRFKYNYKGISKIICVSTTTFNAMKIDVMFKNNYHKLVVVPDGIDTTRSNQGNQYFNQKITNDSKGISIGHVANHNNAKDLPTLLQAIHHLVYILGFKDFKVEQIGEVKKGLTEDLLCLAAELKINDHIKFHGFIEDAINLNKKVDIIVVSSKREGGPSSLLEAMSLNKPIVSTNAGVVPEAIIDGVTGFIVPVGDYKMLAKKILILAKDKKMRNTFGEAGFHHFTQNFTAQKSAEKTLDIYNQLIF